jgi:hypothetical protein
MADFSHISIKGESLKLLILLFSFSFFLFSFNTVISQSKGGRWQFENNGFDTANWDSHEDTGSLMDSAVYSTEIPLQEGFAYLFLDTTYPYGCFRVSDHSDLDFNDENIGISAWIYPLILNDVYFLVNKGRQDSNPKTTNYAIRISSTQHLEFLIRDANNQAQTVASSFTIIANQWTFVAVYYEFATHTVYMWNDPTIAPVDTLAFTENYFSNNDPLTIGAWYNANPATPAIKPFKGRMDDIRISGRMEDIIPTVTSITDRNEPFGHAGFSDMEIFPNPVQTSQSKVNFQIHWPAQHHQDISVKVYNILGQMVFNTNLRSVITPDVISWNLQDDYGRKVNSGIYFIMIEGDNYHFIERLLILK